MKIKVVLDLNSGEPGHVLWIGVRPVAYHLTNDDANKIAACWNLIEDNGGLEEVKARLKIYDKIAEKLNRVLHDINYCLLNLRTDVMALVPPIESQTTVGDLKPGNKFIIVDDEEFEGIEYVKLAGNTDTYIDTCKWRFIKFDKSTPCKIVG